MKYSNHFGYVIAEHHLRRETVAELHPLERLLQASQPVDKMVIHCPLVGRMGFPSLIEVCAYLTLLENIYQDK